MSRAINSPRPPEIRIAPLTPGRWTDLEIVFGDGRGACGNCWCMYWRLPRRDFEAALGAGTRQLFRARVEAGPPPGLLAYRGGVPVGWVQVGPRADVPGWNGARRLTAPTAEAPARDPRVWGISCFVSRAGCRRQGIATALLAGAVDWARQNGARCSMLARSTPPSAVRPARFITGSRRRSAGQAFVKSRDVAGSAADAPRPQRLKS
jgi:GNAT superfamily N-acetyltransferase